MNVCNTIYIDRQMLNEVNRLTFIYLYTFSACKKNMIYLHQMQMKSESCRTILVICRNIQKRDINLNEHIK